MTAVADLARPPQPVRRARSVWNRPFLTIAASNLVSRTGSVVFDVVLAWWLLQRTGSTFASGVVLAAGTVPIAVLGPFAGVLVDRLSRKLVLVGTDLVSAVAALAVAWLALTDTVNLPLLVTAAAVLGACTCLFKPAMRAAVPDLVARDGLARANSLTTGFAETTKVVGPALGAALIPLVGVPGALLVNAASFAVSGLAQASITFRPAARPATRDGVLASLGAGLRYMTNQRIVRNLLLMCGLVNFFLVSFNVLLPLYVSRVLGRGSASYSTVLVAEALGGIAMTGLFLVLRRVSTRPTAFAWYIAAAGGSLALIPAFRSFWALLVLAAAQGALVAAFNTLYFTYIQEVVAPDYLGRVFSIVYMVAVGAMPPSYLLFGYLGAEVVGGAFLVAGLGTAAVALPFLRMGGPPPRR